MSSLLSLQYGLRWPTPCREEGNPGYSLFGESGIANTGALYIAKAHNSSRRMGEYLSGGWFYPYKEGT
jgi:hypothetical protein